ncbi:MAG: radical SAM protein [Firmicutes bacterium]|nr:radical SAM protein [Bacillota bacterium]
MQLLAETDTYVLVSLDGPRENYYAFRGVDKFEQAVAGIEQLIAAGITVQPVQVVHKDSLPQLDWVADFCSLHGIATCTLSPIQPIGRAEAIEHLLLSSDELAQFAYKLSVLNGRGYTKFVTQSVYGPDELERFETARDKIIGFNDDYFYVQSDGVIVCDLDLPDSRAFVLGHAGDLTSLDPDVWQRYQDLLAAAFERGRARLKAGQAVNWHELVQRQAGASPIQDGS